MKKKLRLSFHFKNLKRIYFICQSLVLLSIVTFAQPGKDGVLTVATANTVVNRYTRVTADVVAGSNTVTVSNIADLNRDGIGYLPGGYVTNTSVYASNAIGLGDLIILYQAQGAVINSTNTSAYGQVTNYNGSGTYELAYVESVSGNTITLSCKAKLSYFAERYVQVIRIPQYTTLTVDAGASVVAIPWGAPSFGGADPSALARRRGGFVTALATNLVNNGSINANTAGFRGGTIENTTSTAGANFYTNYNTPTAALSAEKGESIAGYRDDYDLLYGGRYGRGAAANGGGGGNAHNCGGGGGANGGIPANWFRGAGVMNDFGSCGTPGAWALDPNYIANGNALTNSSGGGRGGYSYGASNLDACVVGPSYPAGFIATGVPAADVSNSTWGGDYRDAMGGLGGRPIVSANIQNQLFFGGGGGAGDGNNNANADGGDGGGIVFLITTNNITGTGSIQANGENGSNTVSGHNDAPGGGGGGGTVLIQANTIANNITVNSNGGNGGNQLITSAESEGPGGGGGGGVISVNAVTDNSVKTITGGKNGRTSSSSLTEFPANGATSGSAGSTAAIAVNLNYVLCDADLKVTKTVSNIKPNYGTTDTFTITATNNGPRDATGVVVKDVPPTGYTFVNGSVSTGTLTPPTWTIGNLAVGESATLTVVVSVNTTGTYANTAIISGDLNDPTPDNNSSTVTPIPNNPPVAVNDSTGTASNTQVIIPVAANDTDSDGTIDVTSIDLDPATPGKQTTFTVAGEGTYTANADGTVTFVPVATFNGATTPVNYTILDNDGGVSNTATIKVTVANNPPVAVNDSTGTASNTQVIIPVAANDTDSDGTIDVTSIDLDPATPGKQTTFTVAGQGTYTANADGTVTFVPVATFNGTSTINYTILDNNGGVSNTATIKVTVANNPPVAVNDSTGTASNTQVIIPVAANDTDSDGTIDVTSIDLDPATPGKQTTFTVAGEGTYTANADGTVTFVPVATFNGATTPVNYTILDNNGGVSNTATIKVTVANNPPVAVNDSTGTASNTQVIIPVAANDTDSDGTIDVTSIDLDPATPGKQTTFNVAGQGTYTANADGTVTFVPVATFNGATTPVNYTILDNNGGVSNTATIKVTVANNPPVAVNDSTGTASNTQVIIPVAANDTDSDGTIDVTSIDLDPATPGKQTTFTVAGEGTYTANADGTVTFVPVATFNGATTPVNYTILDNNGGVSNIATIKVTVANNPPVAVNDSTGTASNTQVIIPVAANDTDSDGTIDVTSIDLDPATPGKQTTFTVAGQGTYTANADGTVTFVPVATFNGTSTINYTILDNNGGVSNTATIKVTVANNPPVAVNDSTGTASNTQVIIPVAANDTDSDGTIDITSIDLDPATPGKQTTFNVAGQGTYTANADGTVTFVPVATFNGTSTINYTILDNDGGVSNTATIKVTVANNPPVAVNDSTGTASNTQLIIPVAANDTDSDGTIDVTSIDLDPATPGKQTTFTVAGEGTYTANADGTVTFVPVATFNGATTPVNYTILDNDGGVSNTATIKVTVANNPPVAVNDSTGTASNTQVIIPVAANDTDSDGTIDITSIDLDPATPGKQTTFTVAGEGTYTANADGTVTFVPVATFNGATTPVNYTILDNDGGVSNIATIKVTVAASVLYTIAGSVLNDANGLTDNLISGTGTNAGGLNAVLVDVATGKVTAVAIVQADGTYSFAGIPSANYSLLITTATATVGNAAPAVTLPVGWVSTGEHLGAGAGSDGSVNGILPLGAVNGNISNTYFGIEQPPFSNSVNSIDQINPGGTGTIVVPTLTGTDAEQGIFNGIGNSDTIVITTIPTNGILYYNGVAVAAGDTIKNYNPALLTLDPNDGLITVTFTFTEIDAAGIASVSPATVSISFIGVLPVNITSFTARRDGTSSLLKWSTTQETNSSHFEIERSSDGIHFNTIGTLKAAGNSSVRSNYSFKDEAPLNGNNSYRLKEVDLDGRIQYSQVILVRFDENKLIVIYPNPSVNEVKIQFTGSNWINKAALINVLTVDGKLMLQKRIVTLSQVEKLDVSKCITGSYIIQIITGSEVINKTIQIIRP